jgi:hypothetical protein
MIIVYYIVSYDKYILQVQEGLSSGKDTILPQADNQVGGSHA